MRSSAWRRAAVNALAIIGSVIVILVIRSQFEATESADASPAESTTSTNVWTVAEIDQNQSVWWTYAGEASAAVLNLGPLLGEESGEGIRRWSLVIHLPGTDERLSCVQGILAYDDRQPLWAQGSAFRVQIEPAQGFTWGDVRAPEEIVATVEGLE